MRSWKYILLALLLVAMPVSAQQPDSFKGQLLIATPQNLDPRFDRAILYMVRHTPDSAFGIVINKPYGNGPLANMLEGIGLDPKGAKGEITLHYGGPVAYNRVFILHSGDYAHETAEPVGNGISFTKNARILYELSEGKGPKRILVATGYAGWSAGQLEGEIERGFWTLAEASSERVFDGDKSTLWKRIFEGSELPL